MKKVYTFSFAVLVAAIGFAQTPEKMSYQAVVRNASGELVKSSSVGMKISILQGSSTGTTVYVETQTQTTNVNGLVTLEVGGGTPVTGTFAGINWSTGLYFIKTETDPTGGTSYTITGTSQLLSVPYALYAKNSLWKQDGRDIYYSEENGMVGIGTTAPESTLEVKGIVRASSSKNRYLSFDAGGEDYNAYINFAGAEKPGRIIFRTNGINKMVIANNGRVGIGTDTPTQLLEVNGNALIDGDLTVKGTISGKVALDSINVKKIVGLLGQNYTMIFPDILNNYVTLEIGGVNITEKVIMVSSLGFETERISTPTTVDGNGKQRYKEEAGLSMEFPIVFETANATDIANLKSWFDGDKHAISLSIVIKNLAGNETGRYNCFEYVPDKYEAGIDGRTRFTIKHNLLPNNICHIEMAGADFGNEHSYNAATDKVVEIDGISSNGFSPAVVVNETNRTVTLTMDYNEGAGIYNWAKSTVRGVSSPKNMSVIETTDGINETSRKNYFECITIKWELIYGFGQNNKLKARVVIAYGWWENA